MMIYGINPNSFYDKLRGTALTYVLSGKNDYILMANTGILIQIGSMVEPVTAAALFKMVTLLF